VRRALLKTGYRCNNNCVFCHSFYLRGIPPPATAQFLEKIDLSAAAGCDMVVFSGGEPMIRTDLLEAAGRCARKGMKIGLVTNGRMLFYRDLLDRLIDAGLSYVYVSLHGADRATHNFLTGSDSFRQTVSGIINTSRAGLHPVVNTVVSRRNIGELNAIVDLLCGIGHLKVKFSMIEPKGLAKENFVQIVPGLRETAKAVSAAITHGLDRYGDRDVEFAHDAIPFCLICEYVAFYDDLYTNHIFLMSEADEPDLHAVDCKNRGWSARCLRCSLHGVCLGPFREYIARAGDSELQPMVEQRSNSFLMRPTGVFFQTQRKDCAKAAARACDDLSVMVAAGKKGAEVFRADTRDFSAPQVMAAVRTCQVFQTRGGKLTVLKPARRCAACGACTGVFEPSPARDVVTRQIAAAAASLRGRVLDVGCGQVEVWPKIERLVASGRIEYHALDPDPERVERLCRKSRHVIGHVTRIEDFCFEAGTFDHCLLLGSINHVQDIDAALANVRESLRAGASLIVSDDVPFAVATRDSSSAGGTFEHYRNLDAESAAALLRSAGFEVLRQQPVGIQTERRWAIFGRKPDVKAGPKPAARSMPDAPATSPQGAAARARRAAQKPRAPAPLHGDRSSKHPHRRHSPRG
jgi:MoaA/NifB/PqqE/SkfB family radical SAM enzyme/SAM-dependent methyltransferase